MRTTQRQHRDTVEHVWVSPVHRPRTPPLIRVPYSVRSQAKDSFIEIPTKDTIPPPTNVSIRLLVSRLIRLFQTPKSQPRQVRLWSGPAR